MLNHKYGILDMIDGADEEEDKVKVTDFSDAQ